MMKNIKQLVAVEYLALGGEIVFSIYDDIIGVWVCFAMVLLLAARVFWIGSKLNLNYMEYPLLEAARDTHWDYVENFCMEVLKDKAEAVVNTANVFNTFQEMIKDGLFKHTDDVSIKVALTLLARTRCIERLKWLRRKQENKPSNNLFVIIWSWIKTIVPWSLGR